MRGGTSTGLVIWDRIAPSDIARREELLRHLMGVPLGGEYPANRQTTALGRDSATSNKVFFADMEPTDDGPRMVSTLAQLAAGHGRIDWGVNCGNMSSALQLWAIDTGLARPSSYGAHTVTIRNTNTGVLTTSRMIVSEGGTFQLTEIPGVMGSHPSVDLFLHDPAGAKTGKLLPTGSRVNVIDGVEVSCVDVAVPMVIIRATDVGKTSYESVAELTADGMFLPTAQEHLGGSWITHGPATQGRQLDVPRRHHP
jgi:2-methylaconitate cis-trans-isomerase PrpF